MALVALLLLQPAEAQTPQSIDLCPSKAGAQPSSTPSFDASEAGISLALVCRRLSDRESRRREDALADFDAAIAVAPRCQLALFARATTYWTSGDIARARLDFDWLMRFKRHAGDSRIEEL
jgi:hypothetical protein